MLNHLSIKNIAVISRLDVDLRGGMSVLTGETGAGKSIIIDSINMLLGNRANKELVRFGAEQAYVQAVFDSNAEIEAILDENDIDAEDGELIISRRLTAEGKSTARINGSAVTLTTLREIADRLINIHGQHDNQALLDPQRHILFLDAYAGNESELNAYRAVYEKRREIKRELKSLVSDEHEKARRTELLEYQINEIAAANLEKGEEEDLKEQRKIAANAEKITSAIEEAYANLYENGETQSAYDRVSMAVNALSGITELTPALNEVYESMQSAMYSIEDAAHEIREFGSTVDFEPQTLDDIEERLDVISKLKRKYGGSIEDILSYKKKSEEELKSIKTSDERTAELKSELAETTAELRKRGKMLTGSREKAAAELQSKIEKSLAELNMERARFCVDVESGEEFYENGMDNVEFMISANPGEPLKPLVKIASGGELSRVMLAIKSILADSDSVGTLIFDEIDTGVSGNAAVKIAKKLADIGKTKQVICITHLPQLAAAADNHYLIKKDSEGEQSETTLEELDFEGRAEEIARLTDGTDMTKLAIEHARQMLKNAKNTEN